jgi:putative addiction module antidote
VDKGKEMHYNTYGNLGGFVKLKLRSIGTSTGVILPKQLLDRLKLKKDDVLFASETPEGYLLTPYDPEVAEQVKLGLEIMKEHRETLRALAK